MTPRKALLAVFCGAAPCVPGFINALLVHGEDQENLVSPFWAHLYLGFCGVIREKLGILLLWVRDAPSEIKAQHIEKVSMFKEGTTTYSKIVMFVLVLISCLLEMVPKMWLRLFLDVHLQNMCILQRFLYVCNLCGTL